MMKRIFLIGLMTSLALSLWGQNPRIPASYSQLAYDQEGKLYLSMDQERYYANTEGPRYTIQQLLGNPKGSEKGLSLDFGDFEGTITYGMIPYGQAPHPLPVFRFTRDLQEGKVDIDIKRNFRYPYDFVGWSEKGQFTLGYRLADTEGMVVFEGEVSVTGKGPFAIAPTLYEGPYVNKLEPDRVVVWFETSQPVQASVEIGGKTVQDPKALTHHELEIGQLQADTEYPYTVRYGDFTQQYSLRTAPAPGTRKPFVFGYTSDSRHATGGGERKIYGANAYIIKKMAALAYQQEARFVQFSGDMINGHLTTMEEQLLQYTNWKKAVEPFWHYIPFNVGQGNHEALGYKFEDQEGRWMGFVDKFPYETESAEAAMRRAFVNPVNGPSSEDGSAYDPDPNAIDFPSYDETVFYYTYDNIAVIVMNSDYWYAPSLSRNPSSSGGLHGYMMDNQLDWLQKTVLELEENEAIDHVFVTQHTPVFPNGGHSRDDMWYSGNNEKRPYIAGKPVEKGIIQRRDEYLDILINQSTKVIAVLTGDEHNYNWLKLTPEVPIYPEEYPHPKLKISRPIYQINNGASGAPYYAQEKLPWSAFTQSFSVENALCLFYVDGKKLRMKVLNPDTLNEIDELELR